MAQSSLKLHLACPGQETLNNPGIRMRSNGLNFLGIEHGWGIERTASATDTARKGVCPSNHEELTL